MRYNKALLPNELNHTYYPNQSFSITLPHKNLDLNSFTLYYDGNASVAKHTVKYDWERTLEFPTVGGTPPASRVNNATNILNIQGHGLGVTNDIVHVLYKTGTTTTTPIAAIPGMVNDTIYILKVMGANSVQVFPASTGQNFQTTTPINLGITATEAHSFEVFADRNFASVQLYFPRLSSSVVSEIQISIDNKVQQTIMEYNTLSAILHDVQNDEDDMDASSPDTLQTFGLADDGIIFKESKIIKKRDNGNLVSKYLDDNKITYFIKKWLGFLGESSQYFDATDREVKIWFKLASPSILYKGLDFGFKSFTQTVSQTNLTPFQYPADYELYNIRATIDVLDEIPKIDKYIFRDYDMQLGTYQPLSKKSMTTISLSEPVEWILGTFKPPDYMTKDEGLQLSRCNNTIKQFGAILQYEFEEEVEYNYTLAKVQKQTHLLNNSYYFVNNGDGVRNTMFKWNTADLTPRMDMVACLNETKKCFGDFERVQNIYSFEADFFINAIRVDDNSYDYKQISWEVEADTQRPNSKGGQPMLFVCYMNHL